MTFLQQLTRERQACLEPAPAVLRSVPDAPQTRGIVTTEASDLENIFACITQSIQLTSGAFSAEATSVSVASLSVHEFTVNRGVLIRAEAGAGRLLVGLANGASRGDIVENGRPLPAGGIIVVSGRDLTLCVRKAASMTWLEIDLNGLPRDQRLAIHAVLGGASGMLDPHATYGPVLRDHAAGIVRGTERGRDAIDLVLQVLQHSRFIAETEHEVARAALMRDVEVFMWENIEGPLTLEQICRTSRCKVRTLIYAFKAMFGLSPMKYFKVQRLNAVRRKLATAESGARIFDIAADCGFWHMGHFGTNYKAMFGATPQATLKRRPARTAR